MTGTHNLGQMKDDALGLLAAEIRAGPAGPLHRSARQAVPGEGSGESGIFFLGEAPGYNEDVQGRPFVGAAGQLLDELLAGVGLDRSKVFITNVVRHRPPENRDPLPDEVAACDMWLRRHLEVLKPRVIVTLGRHAMYKFFPAESISRVHGKLRRTTDGLVVFPMYHPAAALHQPALRSALVADMSALAAYLETARPAAKERVEERPVVQTTLFSD
ncbi:MAG TPA: uracil-DNA glycosylase [Candidatus Limnocylindrales bacterium]|nr:uracil-DNA glycosylase [Candidatus Limnocylindrales bacterium]